MKAEQSEAILGFDISGITSNGNFVAVAIKFSMYEADDLLTIWERTHMERLLEAMFEQANRSFAKGFTQQEVDGILDSTERAVIVSRPTLAAPDLTDPPEHARVQAIESEYGQDALSVHLTFFDGGRRSISLDRGRCLLLFGYARNVISDLRFGVPVAESVPH